MEDEILPDPGMSPRLDRQIGSDTRARAGSPLPPSNLTDHECSNELSNPPSHLSARSDHERLLPSGLVHVTSGAWDNYVGFTHPSYSGKFLAWSSSRTEGFARNRVYFLDWERDRAVFTPLSDSEAHIFMNRHDYSFSSANYAERVLRPLLLGSRIIDYYVRMDPSLSAEEWRQICIDEDAPESDFKGRSIGPTLEFYPMSVKMIPVSRMLELAFNRKNIDASSLDLLDRIYGAPDRFSTSTVRIPGAFRLWNGAGITIVFDDQQSEAVLRYREDRPAQPDSSFASAFIVEGGPGTGKTLLATAMSITFPGQGLQLLLAPSEHALDVLAETVYRYRRKGVLYLGERHSAFPRFAGGAAFEEYDELRVELNHATSEREKLDLRKRMRRAHADGIAACGPQDIIIATVEGILKLVLSEADHPIKQQVMDEVSRVVVDDCQGLTEAALNSLIIAFPHAIFAFIGDCKMMPPDTYLPGDLASDLASAPAIEVLKRKRNLPIVTLRRSHRTALCEHYSDAFYGGRLTPAVEHQQQVEEEDDDDGGVGVVEGLPLLAVLGRGVTKNLVFLELPDDATADVELDALEFVVRHLQREGVDEGSVKVVAFSDDQVERARSRLPDYKVTYVEAMQGKESPVVVLLTTVVEATRAEDLLSSQLVNVAVSRHKDALVVIGTGQFQATEPWSQPLVPHFNRVVYDRV